MLVEVSAVQRALVLWRGISEYAFPQEDSSVSQTLIASGADPTVPTYIIA